MAEDSTEDRPRLIEHAFPLEQASIDSVHEKNIRHGHISTLHIWPARRPLAACRSALIATLLSDPGTLESRRKICERIGGKVVEIVKRTQKEGRIIEEVKRETSGGILHWGREADAVLDSFRDEIKKAYGGRAPRVLDPFAGGGAIPLEAMRLGCEVTAVDINPVAWFLLKCTLDYPKQLADKKYKLPAFVLKDQAFMEEYLKAQGSKGSVLRKQLAALGFGKSEEGFLKGMQPDPPALEATLAWHVRAWGRWVLSKAKADLSKFYPNLDGQQTVAYLWARTVRCKNCHVEIPLLKTLWLCRVDAKKVLLTIEPRKDKKAVEFGIRHLKKANGGNDTQRRENEKKLSQGTMSRKGAWCPCCGKPGTVAMEMEDIRQEGMAGRLGVVLTAVVTSGPDGKSYRLPLKADLRAIVDAEREVAKVFKTIPFGLPDEPLPSKEALGFRVPLYGFDKWRKLFTPRQLLALGTFVTAASSARDEIGGHGYSKEAVEAICAYLALSIDRLADRGSSLCRPDPTPTQSGVINTFSRFALPMNWDFIEAVPTSEASGGFSGAVEWVALVVDRSPQKSSTPKPTVLRQPAQSLAQGGFDVVVTDPPYYDAIPYSDLMDFFYVWLRRSTKGLSGEIDSAFASPLAPKWDHEKQEGELIDDSGRFDGDAKKSRTAYEDGMAKVFSRCHEALNPTGRFVVVFAHKKPDAWETLASAIIRSGFVVDGSWPIQTEMGNRTRALGSAALSSSVWLVCKKRPETARPGWDNRVLEEMRESIGNRLQEYWKAGIRGPDFVWAATGPALEPFSKHPVVKKANEPGKTMDVGEFLRAVRRIVVDFVVGRVLAKEGSREDVSGLDDVTTYYLLHRYDFKLEDAPIGPCILYAVSCGLSDGALADHHEILVRTGGQDREEDSESEEIANDEGEEGTGSTVRLRPWNQRKRKSLGQDAEGRPAPLIDQVHRLMHLWKAGDVLKVEEYIEERTLRKNALFLKVLQALIELSPTGSDERSILEKISNHVAARGVAPDRPRDMFENGAREQAEVE